METNPKVEIDIPQSAQFHLTMVQGIIERMSSNSTACKAWCITIVSALLVLLTDRDNSNYVLITSLPIILFFFLDTYYLSLEKRFRKSHNSFIDKLHSGKLNVKDLYAITPEEKAVKSFFHSVISLSIWTFYLSLVVLVFLIRYFIVN